MVGRPLLLPIALWTLSASACLSHSTLTTARPIEKGVWQATIAPALSAAPSPAIDDGRTDVALLPNLEMAARFGISSRVDGAVRFSLDDVGVDIKVALRLPDDEDALRVGVALNPQLRSNAMESWMVALPMLIGIDLWERDQLVFGPSLRYEHLDGYLGIFERVPDVSFLVVGASVGYLIYLSRSFALFPEIYLGYSIRHWREDGRRIDLEGGLFPNAALGLVFF